MKSHKISQLFLMFSILGLLAGCGAQGNAEASFWVRGNCEMCKATIEDALHAQPGVASAEYDLEAHTLHVRYDSTKINESKLHAACAGVGYETKVQPAQTQAYADLPKCCKKPADQ